MLPDIYARSGSSRLNMMFEMPRVMQTLARGKDDRALVSRNRRDPVFGQRDGLIPEEGRLQYKKAVTARAGNASRCDLQSPSSVGRLAEGIRANNLVVRADTVTAAHLDDEADQSTVREHNIGENSLIVRRARDEISIRTRFELSEIWERSRRDRPSGRSRRRGRLRTRKSIEERGRSTNASQSTEVGPSKSTPILNAGLCSEHE